MTESLTIQLLEWIEARPRTYAEAIEAWRTSCPRLSVWDDATTDGLIRSNRANDAPTVELTPAGQAKLSANSRR